MKKQYFQFEQWLIPALFIISSIFSSCKKFLEVDTPPTRISSESAYKDDATANSVLIGIYDQMADNPISTYKLAGTSYFEELSADNLVLNAISSHSAQAAFYQNALEPTYKSTANGTYWRTTYQMIYTINTTIIGLTDNKSLTPAVAKRLLGEAYFLRAFNYFYLINLYGDVPLILSTDYVENSKAAKSSASIVYNQILADLGKAESLLDNSFVGADVTKVSSERVRPNLSAVNALQARVNLYMKNYSAAEAAATKVINQTNVYSFTDLDKTFLKNSPETIWSLLPVQNNLNTVIGYNYILPPTGPDYQRTVYASDDLINSFEAGDARKTAWLGSVKPVNNSKTYVYPAKYKIGLVAGSTTFNEYTIVLRLAEQYLIRAEARNELSNSNGAVTDLNVVRSRGANPLPNFSGTLTKIQLRPLILNERRVELFAEWGHRWFDLKRSGTLDQALTTAENYKGGTWASYKALYPIPVTDIQRNPAIVQNTGY
jgi:hypothetical protein